MTLDHEDEERLRFARDGFAEALTTFRTHGDNGCFEDAIEFLGDAVAIADRERGYHGAARVVLREPGHTERHFTLNSAVLVATDSKGQHRTVTVGDVAARVDRFTPPESAMWNAITDPEWSQLSWVFAGDIKDLARAVHGARDTKRIEKSNPFHLEGANKEVTSGRDLI